ncbi:hypothetical protein E3N88_20242 [Mikania micrantha]|uniref:non-specific serine/threonine protein kinase n=1 Tax=Mikania micrantha TaxID=192012 RepID=A0A5N6NHM5_9ASTR|nr:hypothetical protein E3N88_20242 [Mikania micrantha]
MEELTGMAGLEYKAPKREMVEDEGPSSDQVTCLATPTRRLAVHQCSFLSSVPSLLHLPHVVVWCELNSLVLPTQFFVLTSQVSTLNYQIHGKPVLDWSRRKNIALGTARGLLYLHEQSDPKIIHRDVKAANILLDGDFEAVVGDFGLAKLLDHGDSHVTTAVKKLHQDGKLKLMVDKSLKNNFDASELQEMVQVALLCTQFNPLNRPKMSEVLRMLEGEGLVERWEASENADTPRFRALESFPQRYADCIEESSLVSEAMELSGPR